MKIAYLLESTGLCGGVKVVFNHADALIQRGHDVCVLSRCGGYPQWFDKKVPFRKINKKGWFRIRDIEDCDIIVATSPMHLVRIYDELQGHFPEKKIVHFIQGYEGDYSEGQLFMDLIKKAYSLPVPKITVSDNLSERLLHYYPDQKFVSCGQGLEHNFFYTAKDPADFSKLEFDTVFLIGPLEISIKRIRKGLEAYKIFSEKMPGFKLVRISTVDTRRQEEEIAGNIDEFYLNLTPKQVGVLFRSRNGILLSPSSSGEGFGLPPVEAMACGIPVVITDIPSYKTFGCKSGNRSCHPFGCKGDYAHFVPVDDAEKMAEAMIDIAENREKTALQIKNGLIVASEYSYANVADNLEVFFKKCLKKN